MAEDMNPFLAMNKQWMIKKILVTYFRSKNMFVNIDRERQAGTMVSFHKLLKLSEVLFIIKEDMHLLFKRAAATRAESRLDSERLLPDEKEIELINNVGLLFHKAMVARELAYVVEQYSDTATDTINNQSSLDSYLVKMRHLFEEGMALIRQLFKNYKDNVVLLHYLIKNEHYVRYVMGEELDLLFHEMHGGQTDRGYLQAAEFCLNSGWIESGKKCLQEALRVNPLNETARAMLHKYEN